MEIVCTRKVPRVQISSSPPDIYNPLFLQRVFLLFAARSYWIHISDTFQVRAMNDLEPLNIPKAASHSPYLSKYRTYLSHHRGIRYFRITVPNYLRSLLGKTEIRRSLDDMKSRTARSKAVRLSVAAQTFFALVEEIQSGRIQLVYALLCRIPHISSYLPSGKAHERGMRNLLFVFLKTRYVLFMKRRRTYTFHPRMAG